MNKFAAKSFVNNLSETDKTKQHKVSKENQKSKQALKSQNRLPYLPQFAN